MKLYHFPLPNPQKVHFALLGVSTLPNCRRVK